MAGHAGGAGIGDEIERIAGARVLGQAGIVDVGNPLVRVEHDVLENGAEAADGGIDLGLGGRRQADHLGVAATLEIEDAVRAPAMLVVADQRAAAVGRQGRLAGAGEAEEDRRIAARADIGRAMHRQHVARRQQEVEQAEDRFLDLAGIGGAADQCDLLGEIDEDEGFGIDPVALRRGLHLRRVQDSEAGAEIGEVGGRRADEHVAREERMPAALADQPHRQAILGVGAAEDVLDEGLAALKIAEHALIHALEHCLGDRPVDVAPGDIVFARRLLDDVLVLDRAAGMDAGIGDEAAAGAEHPLATAHCVLVEQRNREVPMDRAEIAQPMPVEAEAAADTRYGIARCRAS